MTSNDTSKLLNKYLYYWVMNNVKILESFYRGPVIKHPDMAKVLDLKIPLPPLKVQQEIIRIIEKLTNANNELIALLEREIAARKQQYEYYRDKLLTFTEKNSGQ